MLKIQCQRGLFLSHSPSSPHKETGYKVFRPEILERISVEEDRFGFEPKITARIAKMKVRIYEVGISYSGITYKEGKKIGWKDGFSAIRCFLKYNLLR